MNRTDVIRGLIRILTKADNHDNGETYDVALYQDEYDAIEEAIRLLEADEKCRADAVTVTCPSGQPVTREECERCGQCRPSKWQKENFK